MEEPDGMPEAEAAEATMGEGTSELASRWLRLVGAIVDIVIVSVVWWGTWAAMGRPLDFEGLTAWDMVIWSVYEWAIYLAVNGYLLHKKGQTVGKVLAGTRIVGLDDRLVSLLRLFVLRVVVYGSLNFIPVVGSYLFLLGVLLIFRRDRRCLHDHFAGTKVVMA